MDTEKLIKDIVTNVMSRLEAGQKSKISSGIPKPENIGKVKAPAQKKVVCGVSVRHVHLCAGHLEVLFGSGYELQVLRELYQPGTYAYKETVTLIGPRLSAIQNVRILGPLRKQTQVELAKTDCIILGIDAPVKPSGDLSGTASVVIVGPKGAVYLKEGVIRANRHMHLSSEDAGYFGIEDNTEVDVRVPGPKGLTFNNVQVRVSEKFKSEMHVDTDDANAADITNGTMVEIVDASCISPIIPALMADKNGTPPQIPDGSFSGEITDTNVLRNIGGMLSGKMETGGPQADLYNNISSGSTKSGGKSVITVEDLDEYKDGEIEVNSNVILSPLARDEAVKRGIKISYKE